MITITSDQARVFLAEELRVAYSLTSRPLADALAAVPRERFLGPGPWTFRAEGSPVSRQTDDADPRHVYHNVAVAIDASRNLYNGQPSLVATWIEQMKVAPGERVLHVGCGTGYYTAILAEVVGPSGAVHAIDVDAGLAHRARANLADRPWVTVSHGDGRRDLPGAMDVVVVHAGATDILDEWLDALAPGGRLLVCLTAAFPGMDASIGKGLTVIVAREGEVWSARPLSMVAIYSLVGLRDAEREAALARTFATSPMPRFNRLRRDAHDACAACWWHGANCLAMAAPPSPA